MAVFNYDPFTQLDSVAREIFGGGSPASRAPRFMPMDLYQAKDSYVLSTDLPGVDPDSITVDIDNGVLTVSAKRDTAPEGEVQWITNERFTGTYRRQITLSDTVDTEQVSADYRNGVLTITLPVAERAKSRKISITHSDSSKEIDA